MPIMNKKFFFKKKDSTVQDPATSIKNTTKSPFNQMTTSINMTYESPIKKMSRKFKTMDSMVSKTVTWRDRSKVTKEEIIIYFDENQEIEFEDLYDNAEDVIINQNKLKTHNKNPVSLLFRAFSSGPLKAIKNEMKHIRKNLVKSKELDKMALSCNLVNAYEPWERRKENRVLSGDFFGGFQGLGKNIEYDEDSECNSNFYIRATEETKVLHFNMYKFLAHLQVIRVNKEISEFFTNVSILNVIA